MVPGTERSGFSGSLAPCMVAGAALGCWGAARAGLCQEGGQARIWQGAQRSTARAGQGPRSHCERQGVNCYTTCLEERTLPSTKSFYLRVNLKT